MTKQQREIVLTTDAQFVGAVCAVLAEGFGEAVATYYEAFRQNASRAEFKRRDEISDAEVRDILLHTARTAVRLLEGR